MIEHFGALPLFGHATPSHVNVPSLSASGPLPTVSKGTHVIIPLVEELEDGRWEAAIVTKDDKRIRLSVNSPPTAIIGQYQLTVETNCTNGQAISTHDPANDIYMLFNPWCEGKHGTLKKLYCNCFSWISTKSGVY